MMSRRPAKAAAPAWLALATAVVVLHGTQAWAQQGKQAWTATAVSSGLHSVGQPATVAYEPGPNVAAGSVITKIYADRDYVGAAHVQSSLCWGGTRHCVDIVGRSINTPAFNGLEARGPIYLVHRVRAWHGSHQPLYIKGNVTVWYSDAPSHGLPR